MMGAAAAMLAQAIKASGVVVHVEPEEFLKIVDRVKEPLVVVAEGGFFGPNYQYLTSYKGLGFFAKSDVPLQLPTGAELVKGGSMWMPG